MPRMGLLRSIEAFAKQLPWMASSVLTGLVDRPASEFYDRLVSEGYEPELLLNVLPQHKLVYIVVPKAASTRIRMTLARIGGRHSRSLKPSRRDNFRGPYGPRSMTNGAFVRLVTSPDALRFSFVRNPYARALSCWADKFRAKPLVPGDPFIDLYLARRAEVDAAFPAGPEETLSFRDFVVFAAAMARTRCDVHIQAQADILSVPGIDLNFIGKVEDFARDFARVLDHLAARDAVRRDAIASVNASLHDPWWTYYTPEFADRVYRAYECDFDRFRYPRSINC
jgi:hypothetical protein